ncbi:hypothetical protein [Pseudomonas koreensis]|uniref:hypothetical protein n=1 Tax=Pseudomonas koreensis TaxID=198620 RepID=UPI002FCB9AC0
MFAPITRSMTLTLGLCGAAISSDLLAQNQTEEQPSPAGSALELASTSVTAQVTDSEPRLEALTRSH